MKTKLLIGCLLALLGLCPAKAEAKAGSQHYLYTCSGYSYSTDTGRYVLPADCRANPYLSPGTHSWLTARIPGILTGDGRGDQAAVLNGTVQGGHGRGGTRLQALTDGVIAADTKLHGCTAYGRSIGWPIGDHLLNPYRHFGGLSYNRHESPGWQGYGYVTSNGRTTGPCAGAPRIRTHAGFMADEFFERAVRSWQDGRSGDAMYNLGIALHAVQDVGVPSHAHPEVNVSTLQVRNPRNQIVGGQDVFPAWSNAHKNEHAISVGGLYDLPQSINGVPLKQTGGGGFVYAMAATAHPYSTYHAATSATARSTYRCDVTNFPEDCADESEFLLKEVQRYSAGLFGHFYDRI